MVMRQTRKEENEELAEAEEIHLQYVPYYSKRKLEEDEEKKEEVGKFFNRPGRSGHIEILDGKRGTETSPEAYADLVFYDGKNKSPVIDLEIGGHIEYEFWDDIKVEWIKIRAVNGWIRYRVHLTPGLSYLLVEAAKKS
jgi:hypothetical protein